MISHFYTETITLLTSSTGTTGYWSTSTGGDYSTGCAVSAAVNLLSGGEKAQYGELGHDVEYKCFADVSTEILEGRRCRWDGDTFEIVDVPKNTMQKNHHLRFLLKRL